MVNPLTEAIMRLLMTRMSRILDAAAVGMPTSHQHQAYRKIVLDEFGNQSFLPELEALVQQHGLDRNGQAKTAGKGVPR
ncbi:MAG: hypothetical protein IV101_10640 [Dechloromonas sp.]|uniref:hypothetical protein n=1 Tax=Dechloromonas sp. TaxID=1917218 RepID=UPI0027EFFFD2|nr:hypothetical protein [Dechloromonas sp.]MBT9521337.1 hypothetical protein [Dechloromonas sp.]